MYHILKAARPVFYKGLIGEWNPTPKIPALKEIFALNCLFPPAKSIPTKAWSLDKTLSTGKTDLYLFKINSITAF